LSILAPPLTGDPLSIGAALPPDRTVAALWRRAVAFAADGVIIGFAGFAITVPFFDALSRLGVYGRLLGFLLALPYFATLNSKIGNGQTLGKRWMHIQVIDEEGKTISFGKSVVRYAVFAIPYYLDKLVLPTTRTPWLISTLISFVIAAVGGATLYLVLFNRHTRQGIHDLSAGSYVADGDKTGPLRKEPIWKGHWVIIVTILLVITSGGAILGKKLTKWGPFPELSEDVRIVEKMKGVQSAGAQDLSWASWGSETRKKILVITVMWTGRSADEEAFASEVAKTILQHDPDVQNRDLLRIVMIRGYDLGIAHTQVTRSFEKSPADWRSHLFGTSPVEGSAPTKL